MIQRIQSVYLFLGVIAIAMMFFFPVANFYGDMHYFYLNLSGISDSTFVSINTIPLLVVTLLIIVFMMTSIFLYRNRPLQIRLIRFTVLITIGFIIILYFGYIDTIKKAAQVDVEYKIGIYFPLIALLFQILAMRAVMSDEKKVRAADRLR